MRIAFGLGGNHPGTLARLTAAVESLRVEMPDLAVSGLYETAPLGPGTQPFLNAAAAGTGGRTLAHWWRWCREQEVASGRDRGRETVWGDRILDCDILLCGEGVCVEEDLVVPHPQLHRRPFALAPLAEIAGDWIHPVWQRSVEALWQDLQRDLPPGSPGGLVRHLSENCWMSRISSGL